MRQIVIVLAALLALPAFAGFRGYNASTVNLGTFNELKCSTGLTCTRVGTKFNIVSTGGLGVLQSQVTATATTLTSAQCGSTVINAGAIEVELPEASAVLGCRYTFIVGNATAFTIDPDAGDQIALITNTAGDAMVADAVGESIVLEAISASIWAPVGAQQGTWSDANP